MESTNTLKLFEEIGNVEKSEGAEALTEEKIGGLCKKYDISMTELQNLVVEILSAGEITGFSGNEQALETIAGGKMDFKKSTATLLAALNTSVLFTPAFANELSSKSVVHSKIKDSNNGAPTQNFFTEYIPKKHNDAVEYTKTKLNINQKTAKSVVCIAEFLVTLATTSLIGVSGKSIYNRVSSPNFVSIDSLNSYITDNKNSWTTNFAAIDYANPVENVIVKIKFSSSNEHYLYATFDIRENTVSNPVTIESQEPQASVSNTCTIDVPWPDAQRLLGVRSLKPGIQLDSERSQALSNALRTHYAHPSTKSPTASHDPNQSPNPLPAATPINTENTPKPSPQATQLSSLDSANQSFDNHEPNPIPVSLNLLSHNTTPATTETPGTTNTLAKKQPQTPQKQTPPDSTSNNTVNTIKPPPAVTMDNF